MQRGFDENRCLFPDPGRAIHDRKLRRKITASEFRDFWVLLGFAASECRDPLFVPAGQIADLRLELLMTGKLGLAKLDRRLAKWESVGLVEVGAERCIWITYPGEPFQGDGDSSPGEPAVQSSEIAAPSDYGGSNGNGNGHKVRTGLSMEDERKENQRARKANQRAREAAESTDVTPRDVTFEEKSVTSPSNVTPQSVTSGVTNGAKSVTSGQNVTLLGVTSSPASPTRVGNVLEENVSERNVFPEEENLNSSLSGKTFPDVSETFPESDARVELAGEDVTPKSVTKNVTSPAKSVTSGQNVTPRNVTSNSAASSPPPPAPAAPENSAPAAPPAYVSTDRVPLRPGFERLDIEVAMMADTAAAERLAHDAKSRDFYKRAWRHCYDNDALWEWDQALEILTRRIDDEAKSGTLPGQPGHFPVADYGAFLNLTIQNLLRDNGTPYIPVGGKAEREAVGALIGESFLAADLAAAALEKSLSESLGPPGEPVPRQVIGDLRRPASVTPMDEVYTQKGSREEGDGDE